MTHGTVAQSTIPMVFLESGSSGILSLAAWLQTKNETTVFIFPSQFSNETV